MVDIVVGSGGITCLQILGCGEAGGKKDTVEPYNEYQHTGTGFTFSNYNAHEMRDSLLYAYQVFHENRTGWLDIARRGMEQNFSWSSSAKEYEKLYAKL